MKVMQLKSKTESEVASNLFQEYSALDSGLVHYWKLDDNDNTAQNQITSSPNGTLVNSPTWIGNYNGSYYRPEIISSTDYSPFLVRLDGRSFNTSEYRYSGQGQEHDDNIKGEGNSLNYTYRMHDPRLGRFFAVDRLSGDYPWNSPYAFSENVVIYAIELEGSEKYVVIRWADEKGLVSVTTVLDVSTKKRLQMEKYNGEGAVYYTVKDVGPDERSKFLDQNFDYGLSGLKELQKQGKSKYVKEGLVEGEKEFYEAFQENEKYRDYWQKCTQSGYDNKGKFKVRGLTFNYPTVLNEKFDQNKSELNSPSNDVHWIGGTMKILSNSKIRLHGYTNSDGDPEENKKLSLDRANAIKDFIVSEYNIDPSRIEVVGHGETNLIGGKENEDKVASRRVEVELIDPGIKHK